MDAFLELMKQIAPAMSVVGSLVTVALIPILAKLNKIDTKISNMNVWAKGHEKLDDTRFQAFERSLNEAFNKPMGEP